MLYFGRCTVWPALGVGIELVLASEESTLSDIFRDIFQDVLVVSIFEGSEDRIIGVP